MAAKHYRDRAEVVPDEPSQLFWLLLDDEKPKLIERRLVHQLHCSCVAALSEHVGPEGAEIIMVPQMRLGRD